MELWARSMHIADRFSTTTIQIAKYHYGPEIATFKPPRKRCRIRGHDWRWDGTADFGEEQPAKTLMQPAYTLRQTPNVLSTITFILNRKVVV